VVSNDAVAAPIGDQALTAPKADDAPAPLPLAAAKLAEQSGYETNNYEECLSCQ